MGRRPPPPPPRACTTHGDDAPARGDVVQSSTRLERAAALQSSEQLQRVSTELEELREKHRVRGRELEEAKQQVRQQRSEEELLARCRSVGLPSAICHLLLGAAARRVSAAPPLLDHWAGAGAHLLYGLL